MIRANFLAARRIPTAVASSKQFGIRHASAIDRLLVTSREPTNAAARSSHHQSLPSRHFSSSRAVYQDDASTELGSILTREIEEEEEATELDGLPPELAELDADIRAEWTVVEGISGIGGAQETGGGATMRMYRKKSGSKGGKVGVVFHCQDTEEDVQFDEEKFFDDKERELNGEGGGDEEDEEQPAQAVRFGVTVSKGGKTVVFQCRADSDGNVDIESVMVRDGDAEAVLSELAGGEGLHAALYQVRFVCSFEPQLGMCMVSKAGFTANA